MVFDVTQEGCFSDHDSVGEKGGKKIIKFRTIIIIHGNIMVVGDFERLCMYT